MTTSREDKRLACNDTRENRTLLRPERKTCRGWPTGPP
jgi:hypothetical protein